MVYSLIQQKTAIGDVENNSLHPHLSILQKSIDQINGLMLRCEQEILTTKECLDEDLRRLFCAIKNHAGRIKFLLQNESDVNRKNSMGQTALCYAASFGHKDVVSVLMQHGATINDVENACGYTPLLVAIVNGRLDVVEFLIMHHADIQIVDQAGRTALMRAVTAGQEKSVQLLLQKDADVDVQANLGSTALIFAAWKGNINIVQQLLQHKASMHLVNKDGDPALSTAVSYMHRPIVKLLIDRGANVHHVNYLGVTAFGWAFAHGDIANAQTLLKAGGGIILKQYNFDYIKNKIRDEDIRAFDALITEWNDFNESRNTALQKQLKANKQIPSLVIDKEILSYTFQRIPTITEQIVALKIQHIQAVGRAMSIRKNLKNK